MTEDEKIADVQIEENQILFKDKDGNEYRTGVVNDPQLTERLHKANVSFNEEIKEKDSPFTDFLIAWILPILIFFGIGYYFNRKMTDEPRRRQFPDVRRQEPGQGLCAVGERHPLR
ncbi:hypothetical protein [uncultured Megasphaera sp.]|uniref:hypothetical protein n=1 Tax=uncultured Megasphaera sp. TaxID=165188 RepID=UPI0035A5A33C